MRARKTLYWIAGVFGALVLSLAVVFAVRYAGMNRLLERTIRTVMDNAATHASDPVPLRDGLARLTRDLPEPMQRYFDYAVTEDARLMRGVRMRMAGVFRRPRLLGWDPALAEQYVSLPDLDYVFTETLRPTPLLWAKAMDSYIDGRMYMEARLVSAIGAVHVQDVELLDRLSLVRFFLEAPLFPPALLPGPHLRWEPVDQDTARAVILLEDEEVGSYLVSVDQVGRITRFEAPGSFHHLDVHGPGEYALRSDYALVDGYRVPLSFTIGRILDGEHRAFWSGRVVDLEYDVFQPFGQD